jgi:hypothetical protein
MTQDNDDAAIRSHLWGLWWVGAVEASGPLAASASPLPAPHEEAAQQFAARFGVSPDQRIFAQRLADTLWWKAVAAFRTAIALAPVPEDPAFIRATMLADQRGHAAAKAQRVVWLLTQAKAGEQ